MGFLRNLLFGRRKKKARGSRGNPVRPFIPSQQPQSNPLLDQLAQAAQPSHYVTRPIPNESGYILLTNKKDHDDQMLGRHLEFESNAGTAHGWAFGGQNWRGKTEKVLLDGQVIWQGQIRRTSKQKVEARFFEDWDIQELTRSQVQNILADEDDDPRMYGQTAEMDTMMENELQELREELEAEYVERFEEDYQRRLKQEYPGMFSQDFKKHYNDMVQDELDDSVDSHEDLYHEYIVTPKHIRYKR